MVMARRNLIGGKPLPYLRRVAYLETHGTEWIDTGILFSLDTMIECELYTSGVRGQVLFGSEGIVSNSLSPLIYTDNGNVLSFFFGGVRRAINSVPCPAGDHYVKTTTRQDGTLSLLIDDAEYHGSHISVYPTVTFSIFAEKFHNKVSYYSNEMKLYWLKGEDRGKKVLDIIPVLDLTGRPAMYDEVSGQLFYNQGTGEFAWGELDAASALVSTRGGY